MLDTIGYHTDSAKKNEHGSNLITKSDCLTCHRVKEKNMGPAYVAVAEKYETTPENISYLTSRIIKGGKGVWGEVAMAPPATLTNSDATAMVNYILSLKGVR
jgi:cytochrome c